MSFAIIETGGKQYKVSASKIIEVEKLNAEAVVTANDKMIYQHASIIPAIETKYILNNSSLSVDINCE